MFSLRPVNETMNTVTWISGIKVERKKDTETTITPDDSTDLAEKSGDASDGTSIVSSDTTTVFIVLCIAGSLLLPQELEGENLH